MQIIKNIFKSSRQVITVATAVSVTAVAVTVVAVTVVAVTGVAVTGVAAAFRADHFSTTRFLLFIKWFG